MRGEVTWCEFLAESIVLAVIATGVGVGVAWGATKVLLALFGGALPRAEQPSSR